MSITSDGGGINNNIHASPANNAANKKMAGMNLLNTVSSRSAKKSKMIGRTETPSKRGILDDTLISNSADSDKIFNSTQLDSIDPNEVEKENIIPATTPCSVQSIGVGDETMAPQNISLKNLSLKSFVTGAPLGKGKFGNVYKAKTLPGASLPSSVAIKVIQKRRVVQPSSSAGPICERVLAISHKSILLLRREVEIQSRLCHPHVLKLFGTFHDDTFLYMVLEEASGCDLHKLMTRRKSDGRVGSGNFSESETVKYVAQVASALEYLSKLQVYHRDIKPENLLLDSDNRIKLSDFGWAVHAPSPSAHIRSTLCGTVEYLPPEMVIEKSYTGSADIWSLGILTYELVTGKTPFQVSSDELLLYKTEKKKGKKSKIDAKDDIQSVLFSKLKKFSDSSAERILFGPDSNCDVLLTADLKKLVMNLLKRKGKDRLSAQKVVVFLA